MSDKSTYNRVPGPEEAFKGKKKKYYDDLVNLREHFVDQIRTLSAHSLSSSKQAGEELADIGSDNFIREIELGLMSEEGKTIKAIQEAIGRLKSGEYGICMDCNEKIKEGRLEAIPYAKLCINCKSKREKQGMIHGGSSSDQHVVD